MNLSECDSILLFGGSFDPPHRAHVKLPLLARQAIGAEVVAYIPAACPPLKTGPVLTPANHRLHMLELALRDQPRAVILTDEIDRRENDEPSYTIDTLERLRRKLGEKPVFRLLIGTDQLRVFDRWRSFRRILELAEPLVMLRPPDTRRRLLSELPTGFDPAQWMARLVDLPRMDISSTKVRQRLAAGEAIDDLVPPAVATYIRRNNLYQDRST